MKPRFYWAACAVLLAACSPEPAAEKPAPASASAATLTVPTTRGDAVVPKNPERVAVYDWAALDTLTELGVNVGATTAPVRVDYLQPAFDKAATVGTLFEPDSKPCTATIRSLSLPAGRARKRMNSWRKTRPP